MDGEGCFSIFKVKNFFKFRFIIKLHRDDRPVLEYLRNRLQIGKIYPLDPNSNVDYACRVVTRKADILKLIVIFNLNNFNTTKHLDYLAWREAFLLYISSIKIPGDNLWRGHIDSLKSSMNEQRSNFNFPNNHQVKITPYWLLGFSEGEANLGAPIEPVLINLIVAKYLL